MSTLLGAETKTVCTSIGLLANCADASHLRRSPLGAIPYDKKEEKSNVSRLLPKSLYKISKQGRVWGRASSCDVVFTKKKGFCVISEVSLASCDKGLVLDSAKV